MSLPSVDLVRSRIDSVEDEGIKNCLRACFLFAARITEVVGKIRISDKTSKKRVARGPTGQDVRLATYGDHTAILFNVYTAKREGRRRIIALPQDVEPWAGLLYEYYGRANGLVFPFSRQYAWRHCQKPFQGLTYPIETYTIFKGKVEKETIPLHNKPFRLHALRHLRITELVEVYGFNGFEVATYCGWSIRTSLGMGGQFDRYAHLDWQSYFPKLLREKR